jgi:hypothetical protein
MSRRFPEPCSVREPHRSPRNEDETAIRANEGIWLSNSSRDKARIVLEGLRDEASIAESLPPRGIVQVSRGGEGATGW